MGGGSPVGAICQRIIMDEVWAYFISADWAGRILCVYGLCYGGGKGG